MRIILSIGAVALVATLAAAAGSAPALAKGASQKECSTKYQAAKAGNTLNGMTYAQFRKAQCGTEEPAATPAAAPAPAPAPAPATTAAAPAPKAAPAAAGAAVFPTAVSPTYSKESAGKARMHTCLDQYKANGSSKGAANGGLKWIEKGGGYYSECNKKLKG